MSSSTEAVVLRGTGAGEAQPVLTPDLRAGTWTRHGTTGLLGDAVTERALGVLADDVRTAAHAQGYAAGWAEGRRAAADLAAAVRREQEAARDRADERLRQVQAAAVAALATAVARLDQLTGEAVARVEEQATELACALTREIVGHELAQEDTAAVVRRALALLPTGALAEIRVHPDVVAECDPSVLADLRAPYPGVRVRPDHDLAPGDAVVELADRLVDLRVDRALERVRVALTEVEA